MPLAIAPEELVDRYFNKVLNDRKSGSRVELIVSEEKLFSLTYNFRKGQMNIVFILLSGIPHLFYNIINSLDQFY